LPLIKLNFDCFSLKTGENSSLGRLRVRACAQLFECQYPISPIIPARVIQNSTELESISCRMSDNARSFNPISENQSVRRRIPRYRSFAPGASRARAHPRAIAHFKRTERRSVKVRGNSGTHGIARVRARYEAVLGNCLIKASRFARHYVALFNTLRPITWDYCVWDADTLTRARLSMIIKRSNTTAVNTA